MKSDYGGQAIGPLVEVSEEQGHLLHDAGREAARLAVHFEASKKASKVNTNARM